ncbi:TraX family protein [Pseudobutyrivibrio xylanivorans]|uniref:TraX protein n=1 Tax=Pseudobutyrivibrio xylanivorans DSM 14809 TaxID=1123012 RepID=A0A1M6FAX7_PSEXY|nr:TraX family protein [Pseudobutyrivibrio xylanivorans]SHI94817.1 TraX protein [Pseudobutyrivibrio xylanivorans DSM 14809]
MERKNNFSLSGNALKLIAIISMLIDHVAYGLYYNYGNAHDCLNWDLYQFLRIVGRLAFPLYCFLLVEGFFHTRDLKKYCIRLIILGLISEVLFDWALFSGPLVWNKTNVIFTLLIGLILIWIIDTAIKGPLFGIENEVKKKVVVLLCYAAGCAIAYFGHTDYNMVGVAVIVVMYYFHGNTVRRHMLAFGLGVLVLAFGCGETENAAFLMLLPIAFYNGERGSSSKVIRYTFNYFYPAHLLIIGIVRAILL